MDLSKSAPGQDPCARLFAMETPDYPSVSACYRFFPYVADLANSTISTLKSLLQLNVFQGLSSHPSDPSYAPPFDIDAALESLRPAKKAFPSDFLFQTTLSNALIGGKDGHMGYIPTCYDSFAFAQPFAPIPLWNGSDTKVVIAVVSRNVSRSLSTWLAAEIISIDGTPALPYFSAYADTYIGVSKSPAIRLIIALARTIFNPSQEMPEFNIGRWAGRRTLPENPTVRYELRRSNDTTSTFIDVPWSISFSPSSSPGPSPPLPKISSAADYWQQFCAPSSYKDMSGRSGDDTPPLDGLYTVAALSKSFYDQRSLPTVTDKDCTIMSMNSLLGVNLNVDTTTIPSGEKPKGDLAPTTPSRNRTATASLPSTPKEITPVIGSGFSFSSLDREIGILQITSIERIDKAWASAFATGLNAFASAGLRRWIIDLSNNGGGDICTSQTLQTLILPRPNTPFPDPWGTYHTSLRSTPLLRTFKDVLDRAGKTSVFSASRYANISTEAPLSSSGPWINPGVALAPGDTAKYTHPALAHCQINNAPIAGEIRSLLDTARLAQASRNASDLIILSNGFCGSACATLANALHDAGVRSILSSPLSPPGTPPGPFTAFPGGEAIVLDDLAFLADKLNAPTILPPPPPAAASIGFAIRMNLRPDDQSLEYHRENADLLLPVSRSSVINIPRLWYDAASLVGWSISSPPP